MDERNERGVVIGGGPFQPQTSNEVRDMANEIDALRTERDSLRSRLLTLLNVATGSGLEELLVTVLGRVADDVEVTVSNGLGNESLEITVEGLHVNDDDELSAPVREFEVSTTVSFEHSATLRASDQDEAHDLFVEALRDALHQVSVEIESDAVEHQFSHSAEFDYVNVHEA